MPRPIGDLRSRLDAQSVRREDTGCLEWTGWRLPKGYGSLRVGGRQGKNRLTHRLEWELEHGPIPQGMCVLHKCDNPPCHEKTHLWLGTKADNNADMAAKGRANRKRTCWGETHGRAKLTDEQVAAIRASEIPNVELAQLYGLGRSYIWAIKNGKSRQEIPENNTAGVGHVGGV